MGGLAYVHAKKETVLDSALRQFCYDSQNPGGRAANTAMTFSKEMDYNPSTMEATPTQIINYYSGFKQNVSIVYSAPTLGGENKAYAFWEDVSAFMIWMRPRLRIFGRSRDNASPKCPSWRLQVPNDRWAAASDHEGIDDVGRLGLYTS